MSFQVSFVPRTIIFCTLERDKKIGNNYPVLAFDCKSQKSKKKIDFEKNVAYQLLNFHASNAHFEQNITFFMHPHTEREI